MSHGGIGTSSLPLDSVLLGNGVNALLNVPATTIGYLLTAQGTLAAPLWSSPVALGNQTGLSVVGVTGTASTTLPVVIVGTTDQVLRVAQNGTTLGFGAINLATSAAVTGGLPAVNVTAFNLASSGVAGGVQGVLPAARVTAFSLGSSGAGGVQGKLSLANGGINTTTLPLNGVVLGNSTNALTVVAATTAGLALTSQGSAAAPIWAAQTGFASQTGLSVYGVAGTASAFGAAIIGTTNQVLRVAQNGTTLGFGAANLATTAAMTGQLQLANGGIATSSLGTAHGVVIANGTNALHSAWTATVGYLFASQGSTTDPIWANNIQISSAGPVQFIPAGVNGAYPGGGNATCVLAFGTNTALGIYFGPGAPTIAAATGSLYLRTDRSGVTFDIFWINIDGHTAWEFITTH